MWIFNVISDFMVHTITGLGILGLILGFVLGFIPLIKQYKLSIQVISILIFAFGVYLEGGLSNQKEWEARVKDAEMKAAHAEMEAAKKNTELQALMTAKNTVIKEKGNTIIRYVDRYKDREVLTEVPGPERIKIEKIIEYVENCPIPKELVNIHNEAATLHKNKDTKK